MSYAKEIKSTKEMKRILVLGVCALFIACSSSSEKSSDADTSASVEMDTAAVTSPSIDTTNAAPAVPVAAVETAESKVTEVKAKETPAVKEAKPAEPVKPAVVAQAVDTKKGETLISKSDCFACHKVNEKLLGPSYKDVANKYSDTKANIDYLVKKIKAGGSGVWGAIPMSPHPALSDEDAEAMVHYILSVK
jgi:cytochrome c